MFKGRFGDIQELQRTTKGTARNIDVSSGLCAGNTTSLTPVSHMCPPAMG